MSVTADGPATAQDSEVERSGSRVPARAVGRWLAARKPALVRGFYESQFDPQLIARYAISGAGEEGRALIERSFLGPLVDLLIAIARTGEPRYRDVYLDERLRYAPHRADPTARLEFFTDVVRRDLDVVRGLLTAADDGAAIEGFFRALHAPLLDAAGTHAVRLLAVGDCLLNEVRVFLPRRCRAIGVSLDMRCLYFSAAQGRNLAADEVLAFVAERSPDLLSFSFFTYEGLPPYTALLRESDHLTVRERSNRVESLVGSIHEFLGEVRNKTDAPFLVHNASGLPLTRFRRHAPFTAPLSRGRATLLRQLNEQVGALVSSLPNCLLLDEVDLARTRGYRACARPLLPRSFTRDALFHTAWFGAYLAEPYEEIVRSYRDLRKAKVLLVDFDNTLWEGVAADGPVRQDRERQTLLRELKNAGMLLVAVSKNDPARVPWGEMVLQPADFVSLQISWQPKAQSIQTVAQELDLGIDSFVYIDDSPEEREFARSQLPTLRILDAGDPYTWRAVRRLLAFPNTRATEEARARTELYRAQAERRAVQTAALDYPAMLASLGLTARIGQAARRDLDRVAELVQRTNQFNTTTIRYTKAELQQLLESSDHMLYVADLVDKFGKLGLVATAIVRRGDEESVVESFVMSCRAMGFGLEGALLRRVLDGERAARRVVGKFVPTDRNDPARRLFADHGFAPEGENVWSLGATDPRPDAPPWITLAPRP